MLARAWPGFKGWDGVDSITRTLLPLHSWLAMSLHTLTSVVVAFNQEVRTTGDDMTAEPPTASEEAAATEEAAAARPSLRAPVERGYRILLSIRRSTKTMKGVSD